MNGETTPTLDGKITEKLDCKIMEKLDGKTKEEHVMTVLGMEEIKGKRKNVWT